MLPASPPPWPLSGPSGSLRGARLARCAPEISRRLAERRSEASAEVRCAGEAPAHRDLENRIRGKPAIREIASTAVEPFLADVLPDAHPFRLEELVEIAH